MNLDVMLLPGDGVGPEVVEQAVRILEAVGRKFNHQFTFEHELIGGCSIDQFGVSLTDETVEKCKKSSAVLMGAVGGPKWDDPSAKDRPERGLLRIRKELGVFANLRPVRVHPALIDSSPLRPEKLAGVDMIVVRDRRVVFWAAQRA
jgi:3-isopropylmalate dehydrogenase